MMEDQIVLPEQPKKKINIVKILKIVGIGVVVLSKLGIIRGFIGSKAKNVDL